MMWKVATLEADAVREAKFYLYLLKLFFGWASILNRQDRLTGKKDTQLFNISFM